MSVATAVAPAVPVTSYFAIGAGASYAVYRYDALQRVGQHGNCKRYYSNGPLVRFSIAAAY